MLPSLHCIHNTVKLMSCSFVLGMDQYLYKRDADLNFSVMLFLQKFSLVSHTMQPDRRTMCLLLLLCLALHRSLCRVDEDPVGVATSSKSLIDVPILFLS